jgi:hypothetical protein
MAITLSKATNELVALLKKEKFPDNKKKTYWNILSEQISEDGSWDDDLLDKVKEEITNWLTKLKKNDLLSLWEESETAAENYSDEDMPDEDVAVDELGEELLDLVLDKIEESIPREEYYISEADSKKKYDEDDDFSGDFDDDLFDDDEDFDDFGDDNYYDDDRY